MRFLDHRAQAASWVMARERNQAAFDAHYAAFGGSRPGLALVDTDETLDNDGDPVSSRRPWVSGPKGRFPSSVYSCPIRRFGPHWFYPRYPSLFATKSSPDGVWWGSSERLAISACSSSLRPEVDMRGRATMKMRS